MTDARKRHIVSFAVHSQDVAEVESVTQCRYVGAEAEHRCRRETDSKELMLKRALLLPVILAGCAQNSTEPASIGMANPASVYCVEQGGRSEVREGPDGQTGYCHLPDGRVVEEWELYRSANKNAEGATPR